MSENIKNVFVLSDESINSNGEIILTKGINIDRFKKNPIMLYKHERDSIIGRWENIRIKGKQLIADAIFDENDTLGLTIKKKVDSGFINSVSVGLNIIEQKENIITKSELIEVSIVDIPSNPNSVKFNTVLENGKTMIYLTLNNLPFIDRLKELLKLDKNVSENDILENIKKIIDSQNGINENNDQIEKALRLGYIEHENVDILRYMAKYEKQKFDTFINEKENKHTEKINNIILDATHIGKILYPERDIFEKIGKYMGFETLKNLLAVIPERIKIMDVLNGKDNRVENWGLNEYRKYAPEKLKNNPELYNSLLLKENKKVQNNSLEWYRKNDPEYLKNNPLEYNRLLNEQKNHK